MANFILSPNMDLLIPVIGQDPGPQYASDINSSLSIIDGHDHTSGSGVLITPAAINLNSDLTFQDNNLTNARTLRLYPQLSTPANPSDIGAIFESNAGDLWYINAAGVPVQITTGNSVVGPTGQITNLNPPASAAYDGVSTFIWQSNSGTDSAANMDAGSYILRNTTPNSTNGLTLKPPAGLASNYTITLPTAAAIGAVTTGGGGTPNGYISTDSSGDLGVQTADQIAANMTSVGADDIGVAMDSTGADSVANNRTRTVAVTDVPEGGVLITNSSGSFFTTSTTDVAVTNLGGKLSTSVGARPFMIGFVTTSGSDGGRLTISSLSSSPTSFINYGGTAILTLYRDGSPYLETQVSFLLGQTYQNNGFLFYTIPMSSISFLDTDQTPNAGHIYTLNVRVSPQSGNSTAVEINIQNTAMYIYEL